MLHFRSCIYFLGDLFDDDEFVQQTQEKNKIKISLHDSPHKLFLNKKTRKLNKEKSYNYNYDLNVVESLLYYHFVINNLFQLIRNKLKGVHLLVFL